MKRLLPVLLFTLLTFMTAGAQEITYPKEVRNIFEKADAAITASLLAGKPKDSPTPEQYRTGMKPRIAVPACEEAVHLKEMVLIAGGTPVDIPSFSEMAAPALDLRNESGHWDGVTMPDGWVKPKDEYSVLIYKTVTDWNLPYLGTSDLTRSIDRSNA